MNLKYFFEHRVAWFSLVIALSIGALFSHTIWTMRKEHWDYNIKTNSNLSTTAAKVIEWLLDNVDAELQKAAISLDELQLLEEEKLTVAEQRKFIDTTWKNINSSYLLVIDKHGLLINQQHDFQINPKDLSSHDFFQAFYRRNHIGVFVANPTKNLVVGEYVLPVARAFYGIDGSFSGVIVGIQRMRDINAWLSSMDLGIHSGLNVIREDGLIITRFPYIETDTNLSLSGSSNLNSFIATHKGYFIATAVLDGIERLYTHNRVGQYPIIVNVAQSTKTIFSNWQRNALYLGVFAALLMLGCFGLTLMFILELSQRKSTQNSLFEEKERLHLTLRSISDAVVCVDSKGLITYINPVARKILGLEIKDFLHKPIEYLHLLPSLAKNKNKGSLLRHVLNTGESEKNLRIKVVHNQNGKQMEMEELASLVKARDGSILGAVAVLRDMTAIAANEVSIQRLAFHDALTGLPNRRLLQDRAKQAIARCKRAGQKMAVVYLDLDGFKQINDSLGHQAGDAAIVHAANCLQSCMRESDTVCRLGGDEFLLLLPGLSEEVSLDAITEKMQHLSSIPFLWNDKSIILNYSAGVAIFPDHATDWDELINCADTAMYAAKQSGKDQVQIHQGIAA